MEHLTLHDITDLAVGGGTLVLAAFTARLAQRTRQAVVEAGDARKVWMSIALDSARSRLDQDAPSVDVGLGRIAWPPLGGEPNTAGRFTSPVKETGPRDSLDPLGRIALSAYLSVSNRSDRTVRVECESEGEIFHTSSLAPQSHPPFHIPPGAEFIMQIQVAKQASEWGDLSQGQPPEFTFKISADDLRDSGVTDVRTATLSGLPVVNDPRTPRGWKLAESEASAQMRCDIGPAIRTYFLSRSKNDRLPEVDAAVYTPVAEPSWLMRTWRPIRRGTPKE